MNHCERCGHPLASHDSEGKCSHAVNYGGGSCTCGHDGAGYLRAVVTLPEMLAAVLHTAPGRDANGSFFSSSQARLVGRFAEALLDQMPPTATGNALDLLEAWADRAPAGHSRTYSIELDGATYVVVIDQSPGLRIRHTSVTSSRDAASKALQRAADSGLR